MSLFWRQAIAMVLLVTLPLCVAAIAAVGLWRLDRSLGHVAEEYGEVRQIQGIDRELDSAMFALVSDDPAVRSKAQQHLVAAESALVQYLATQYDDIAAETHQASESVHASGVLRRLQELIGEPAASTAAYNLAARVAQLRSDLGELRDDADAGVQGAHDVARAARRSTLTWMIVASVVSTAACVSLLIWSTSSVNRRLRDLHQRFSS